MAHIQKYTRSASGHLMAHYERRKDEKGEYIKFGNKDIDLSRTRLNYNLAPEHDQAEYLQERLSQVKCMNRADVNVLCDWVVTIPKDFQEDYPDKTKDFFKETYKFLSERYGEKNVVSAYVHMDEATPHMHFAFIPVVKGKKKGQDIEKVSAFKLIDKKELSRFHTDLQKHLETSLGCNCNVLNGATENGNRSITELKLGTLQEQAEKEEKKRKFYKAQAEKKQQEFTEVSKQVRSLKDEHVHLTARNEEQAQELESLQKRIKTAQDELHELNEVKLPAVRSELIQSQLERKRVQESISDLQQQKNEIENQNLQLKNETENLKSEIQNQNQKIEILQKNISYHKQILNEKSKELSQIQKSISIAKNELMEIFNHAKNQFVKIISVADKLKNAEELTEKTRGYYNEKVDRTEAQTQLKEKSKALINETADQTQEVIRRRRRGR